MRLERLRAYTSASGPLYFGRIDRAGQEPLYIGRHAVADTHSELLTINWRAPAAEPFYAATPADPRGITRRRRLDIEDRQVLGFVDEQLVTGGEEHLTEAIVEDITRQRVGEMRQIISTITPEQYELITLGADGTLVVQGGPGTGKTAVGLHRAAWLLYADRQLAREGVLVVGPNRVFITYISQVLPALGEQSVEQRPVDALVSGRPWATGESEELATLLGSGRMAVLLSRLLWERVVIPDEPVSMVVGRVTVEVTPEEVADLIAEAQGRRTYQAGRERFRDRLADRLVTQVMERARGGHAASPETRRVGRSADQGVPAAGDQGVAAPDAGGAGRLAVQEPPAAHGGGGRPAGARGDRPAAGLGAGQDAIGDDAQRVRPARRGARPDRPGAAHVRPRRRRRGAEPVADGAADGRPPRPRPVDHRARRHRAADRRGAAEHVGDRAARRRRRPDRHRGAARLLSRAGRLPADRRDAPARRGGARRACGRRPGRRCRCGPTRSGRWPPSWRRAWPTRSAASA